MERKRKGRRTAVYGRQRKQKKEGCSGMLLLLLFLLLMFFLLQTEKEPLKQMASKAEAVANEVLHAEQAIEALGKSFTGKSADGESAIVVFGRMILGIENAEEKDTDEPIVHCIDESWEKASQEISESAEPLLDPSQLAEALAAEEKDDGTVNQAFRIPSPDIVDDMVYTPAMPMSLPLESYRVTSRFGYRIHPISGNTTFHYGADLAAVTGTKVRSVADGTVSETGYGSINGNYIKIAHADGYVSHYTHLQSIHVRKGEKVGRGECVGTVGSTGYSTGPHLHFELRRNGKVLDPFAYFSF